jgi:hypothetical protein
VTSDRSFAASELDGRSARLVRALRLKEEVEVVHERRRFQDRFCLAARSLSCLLKDNVCVFQVAKRQVSAEEVAGVRRSAQPIAYYKPKPLGPLDSSMEQSPHVAFYNTQSIVSNCRKRLLSRFKPPHNETPHAESPALDEAQTADVRYGT